VLATVVRRKMTEKEVEALENRIKRLEMEESKAKRSVSQVRERNGSMQQAHQRNNALAEERAAQERARRAELKELREIAQKRKETQRANLQRAFTGMYNERLDEARQVREEQERVLEEAARIREQEREKNLGRHDQIRNRRKEVSNKFEQQRLAHQVRLPCAERRPRPATRRVVLKVWTDAMLEPAHIVPSYAIAEPHARARDCPPRRQQEYMMQDFMNMIQVELEQTEELEREIAQLDAIEQEHIERIRQLQEEQRAAYDRLEQALAS
jgi:septal ring factor EnvC (AmiA/AmiB activator)